MSGFFEKVRKAGAREFLKTIPLPPVISFAEIGLVLLLASIVASITWQIFDDHQDLPQWTPASGRQLTNNSLDTYSQLAALHLFGEPLAEKDTKTAVSDIRDIPRSALQARVTGIVSHPDKQQSITIIVNSGREESYRIGDQIYRTNAEILLIETDRVIVDNNGQQEALLLYPNETDQKKTTSSIARAKNVKQIREQLIENPQSLLELVNLSPVRDDGKLAGYRINPRQNPELFRSLGMQPNDLAVAINGYDLTDNQETMQVFAELPNAQQIVLTVEREQQLVNIEISL